MEYYSVIIIKKKNELLIRATRGMDLRNVMLSEKKPYKKVNTVSSHLYEILEQSKLSYSGKKSGCL